MTLSKFGRYEINDVLGQGGMAEVYEAHDPVIDRPVALKIIRKKFSEDARFKQRFRREANIIANLEHRAILPVYDFGEDEGTGQLFLVMRLMPDVLDFRIKRDGPVSLEETSLILNRLAAALTKAHGRGIVHRDIKPANILLDSDGTTFLSDFGLAAFAAKIETSSMPSSYGGSPFYMAPEQWLDEKVDTHTDIYQLGVTLFEMLTGQRPFPETDLFVLKDRHINSTIPNAREINPKLPRNIQSILEKAMAKNPLDRYKTPLELAEAVAALLRPEKIKNRYEIKEELQHGRLAVVYLAHDLFKSRDVALKIMKHSLIRNLAFQQRFEQEKQIITSIQHPAIVPVYDMDQHEGKPYLAMRFMEGASLRDRLRKELVSLKEKETGFPVDVVCQFAAHLAQGLDAIHEARKTHGEINLGNVLLDAAGNWHLSDFHMTPVAELTEAVLEQEAPLGYLPYLAPEQWRGEKPTPRTDVYQFGMMLFELLTGQRPFTETAMDKLRQAIENTPPPEVTTIKPDLPPQFNTIFARAMAKQPQDRFATAGEIVSRLNQVREGHAFETLKRQGDDCYKAKRWDEAIAAYNRALAIRPYDSAVRASLERADRRKTESGIFHRSQVAIEENRWEDAAFFLQQIPATPETDDLLEHVQQKILIEQQYEAGKTAMLRKAWVEARNLLEETDRLEPDYKDVGPLLGQLADKIEDCLQQAREAAAQGDYGQALTLLEPLAEHETAVALRQEITSKQHQDRRWRFLASKKVLRWGGLLMVGILVVMAWLFYNHNLLPKACLATAAPRLHVLNEDDEYIVFHGGSPAPITGEWQLLQLSVEWGPEDLSESCQQFILEDERVSVFWESGNQNSIELIEGDKWAATVTALSPLFEGSDEIVVSLLYDGQPQDFTFKLDFER